MPSRGPCRARARYHARVLRLGLFAIALLVVLAAAPLLGARHLGWGHDRTALPARAETVAIAPEVGLNVVDIGTGPAVVLVHGLPSSIGDWGDTPQRLAALGHRVVVYDRIGYGFSSRLDVGPGNHSFSSNATHLEALLARRGIERAALVGWSYGGGVVLDLAVRRPELASHVALLGSVGPALPDDDSALDRLVASPLGVPLFEWAVGMPPVGRPVLEDQLALMFSGAERVPPGFADRALAQLTLPGTIRTWVWESRRMDASVLRPEAVEVPALVLHGDDDRSVEPSVARDLHERLPRSDLVLVPGGSHMLPVTHAERVARELHEWIARTEEGV